MNRAKTRRLPAERFNVAGQRPDRQVARSPNHIGYMQSSGQIYRIRIGLIVLAVTAVMLLSVLTVPVLAQSPVAWTDYGKIFQPATGAYYPTVLYDANAFSGHGDSYYYKMWYSTGSATGIALAYSNDGKLWTLYNSGGVLSTLTNAHHNNVMFDAGGFGGSGVFYKMWHWDTSQLFSINAIRYAESADGINWINDQAITQDASAKLVDGISPDWNAGSYGPSKVFYNSGASNSGSNPWEYSYVMYYDATTGGIEQIALAYSVDGKFWKLYGSGPVLSHGSPGSWDSNYATHASVVKYQGKYLMWYGGGIAAAYEGIGYAESVDGLVWTKGSSNPIQVPGPSGSWNDNRDYTPRVIYDANEFNGHGDPSDWKMYYSGADSSGNKAVGYKTGPSTARLHHFAFDTISSPQTAGTAFSITITAKDQYGNTVTGYTEPNTLSDSTGTISPTTTGAFTSGVWTGSVTITSAQTKVTITTEGNGESGKSNSFDIKHGPALILTYVDGDHQKNKPNQECQKFLTVKITDVYLNPVEDHTVTWTITSQPAGAIGQQLSSTSTTTDSKGETRVKCRFGNKAGIYNVTATGSMQYTFILTAEDSGPTTSTATSTVTTTIVATTLITTIISGTLTTITETTLITTTIVTIIITTITGALPVGGYVESVNKTAILGTYADLLGLIAAVAVVVLVIIAPSTSRKRKN